MDQQREPTTLAPRPNEAAARFEGLLPAGGVLDKIVQAKAARVLTAEASHGPVIKARDYSGRTLGETSFQNAISTPGRVNVIAEIKRRSPSKGLICPDFEPVRIAESYRRGGAAALSILTEEDFFDGSLDFLRAVKSRLPDLPLLRKDFVFAESQVYESAAAGADAMLLITAILSNRLLARLIKLATELGIAPLVEVHSATEFARALEAGARIVGVNNRDLTDFGVTLNTSIELAAMAPSGITLISESGIGSGADIARLRDVGYSAFLVGEHLMRSSDPGRALGELIADAAT